MLIINNLRAGYHKGKYILDNIDLTVKSGETVGILGRNGSGKSTLAKAICGLVPYIDGEIFLAGKPIHKLKTHEITKLGLGFFLQGGVVFPNLSVYENLVYSAGKISKQEIEKSIEDLAIHFTLLQKNKLKKMKATYLSGGLKHQLAMAMVLIQKPKFLILDEPSAGLSPTNQKAIYDAIKSIKENMKLSILLIEQNRELAYLFSDKLLYLQNGKFHNEFLNLKM